MPYVPMLACGNCRESRDEHCQKCHGCPGEPYNPCCGTPEGAGLWREVPSQEEES